MKILLMCLLMIFSCVVNAQKLYKWKDGEGNVYYSDQVPPEAVDKERSELNSQGIAVNKIERSLTKEERDTLNALLEQQKIAAEEAAEKRKNQELLLITYKSEEDINNEYDERLEKINNSMKAAKIASESQQKSLSQLLEHAANLERNGKTVPFKINQSITLARDQLKSQDDYLKKAESDKVNLNKERDSVIDLYKQALMDK